MAPEEILARVCFPPPRTAGTPREHPLISLRIGGSVGESYGSPRD